jgi:hypothetical protein
VRGQAECICEYHAVSDDERELIRLDPESEACTPLMVEIIAEEISARLAVRDSNVNDPAWTMRLATLAADSLLDRFQVRERPASQPRYRRE